MQKYTLLLPLMVALMAGCENMGGDSLDTDGTTVGGYQYKLHVKNETPTAQKGDMVYFEVNWRNDTMVTLNSREYGNRPFYEAMSLEDPQLPQQDPVHQMLPLLSEGDSATIFVRLDTFPEEKRANLPPGYENAKYLQMDLAIKEIETPEEQRAREAAYQENMTEVVSKMTELHNKYTNGSLSKELTTTESGLRYMILEEGDGPLPEPGQVVNVTYYGMLPDGTVFDNSFKAGRPFSFPLGLQRVIAGWDEGIALLKEGSEALLVVPPELGYGATGTGPIPGSSELLFYVKLEPAQSPS